GRDIREHLDPRVGDQHIVLDADAAPTGDVCAGLNRENHAGRDGFVPRVDVRTPPCDARILVHFDAEPVSGPVPERLVETVQRHRLPGRPVDLESRSAGRDGLDGAIARLPDRLVDLADPRAGPSDCQGTGEVDAVWVV